MAGPGMPRRPGTPAPLPAPLFERVEIERSRLIVRFAHPFRTMFARADYWAEYPSPIDLRDLPTSITLLPAAYAAAPVVWASGGRYAVAGLDERTATAFPLLRAQLLRMHPSVAWAGELTAVEPVAVAAQRPAEHEAVLLFSTGVDSLSSLMRHADERPVLVSVELDDDLPASRWQAAMAEARRIASETGLRHLVIATNAKSFLDRSAVARFGTAVVRWWPRVAHGMALCGLAAPVAHHFGVPRLYIAASDSPGHEVHWGSGPDLDPLIAIGSARVVHDGYHLTRLERLEAAIAGLDRGGHRFALRVCQHRLEGGLRNCEECEKCVRTQIALVLAGADPRAFGFPGFGDHTLVAARKAFEAGRSHVNGSLIEHWNVLGRAAAQRPERATTDAQRSFFEWLGTMDFDAYAKAMALRPRGRASVVGRVPRRVRRALLTTAARYLRPSRATPGGAP